MNLHKRPNGNNFLSGTVIQIISLFLLQKQSQSRAKVSSQNLHQLATPALIPICQDVKPMTNILKVMHNVQFTMTRGANGIVHAPKPDKTPITR